MEAIEAEILAVNEAFYRAFRDRDVLAMELIWAKSVGVACVHPGMPAIIGRDPVLRSWKAILEHPQAPILECIGASVALLGTSSYLTCLEGRIGEAPRLVATNVFVLEGGRWRLVHHHSAPLAPSRASSPTRP
ncbi:MAG: nuclear transport factor 2 family protein, partial [Myxococcales bacterium]|nr:nuclear transport factor 2 family protein [Myxococcales bacterium]